MSRLLRALVIALLAWCGVVEPVQSAVSPPMAAVPAYAYDGHDTSALVLDDASERGPPGPWSDSLRAQPVSAGTASSLYTYDRLVHDANRAGSRPSVGHEVQGWNVQPLHAVHLAGLARVSGSGVAAEGASSGLSIGEKIAGQMGPRGWSKSLMQETIDNPAATHTVWDFTSGTREAATAYARADGSYVVVNDGTRAVVQVSDINKVGWKPVWDDPRFQR